MPSLSWGEYRSLCWFCKASGLRSLFVCEAFWWTVVATALWAVRTCVARQTFCGDRSAPKDDRPDHAIGGVACVGAHAYAAPPWRLAAGAIWPAVLAALRAAERSPRSPYFQDMTSPSFPSAGSGGGLPEGVDGLNSHPVYPVNLVEIPWQRKRLQPNKACRWVGAGDRLFSCRSN